MSRVGPEECFDSPNVGSKARENAKAMSFAFVLLNFQHAGISTKENSARDGV